jgi:hypothetical protein
LEQNKFFRSKEINGKRYQITLLPALKAVGMAKTLSKVILPAIGGAIDGVRDDGLNGPPRNFTDLALTLCTQLEDLDLDNLINTLMQGVMCEGKEVRDINTHFQGELGELVAVLEFALRENFSSFFTGNDLIAPLKKMLAGMGVDISSESSES